MKRTIDVDIVDRLRISWTSMTDMGNAERAEAADEIERLRDELARNAYEFRKALIELGQRMETLTAERDDARRLFVDSIYKGTVGKREIATAHGWTDLYQEEKHDMEGDVE